MIIGIFGGLYGAFVIKFNLRAQAFRKKYLSDYPITEVVVLALLTAITCYWNAWLRIDMTEEMERLFKQCEGVEDYNGICQCPPFLLFLLTVDPRIDGGIFSHY